MKIYPVICRISIMEDDLERNLRRLAEIESQIEELTRLERLSQKVSEHEILLEKLSQKLEAAATKQQHQDLLDSLNQIRSELSSIYSKLDSLGKQWAQKVKSLSEIDAEIISKFYRVETLFERVSQLGLELKKLGQELNRYALSSEVSQLSQNLSQRISRLEQALPQLDEMRLEMAKLKDALESLVTQKQWVEMAKSQEQLRLELAGLNSRLGSIQSELKESLRKLSNVDSELIDRIQAFQPWMEKLAELESQVLKLQASHQAIAESIAKDARSKLEKIIQAESSKLLPLAKSLEEMESRLSKLESKIYAGESARSSGSGRRDDLRKDDLETEPGSIDPG